MMDKHIIQVKMSAPLQQSNIELPSIDQNMSKFKIHHYIVGQLIGKGAFGEVYKAVETYTQIEVAVKIIDLLNLSLKKRSYVKSEISILRKVQHPNIVRVYEILEKEDRVYIFMELLKGSQLFQVVKIRRQLPQETACKIFKQICCAVKYLHQLGICHRDIKAENIMILEKTHVKLIDFGLAKKEKSNEMLSTNCGSPFYKSPQILAKNYSGKKTDIWSLGVLLFVMIEGRYPFDIDKINRRQALQPGQEIYETYKKKVQLSSNQAVSAYEKIFRRENNRIGISAVLCTRLLQKYKEERSKQLSLRQSVKERKKIEIKREISNLLQLSEFQIEKTLMVKSQGVLLSLFKILEDKWTDQTSKLESRMQIQDQKLNQAQKNSMSLAKEYWKKYFGKTITQNKRKSIQYYKNKFKNKSQKIQTLTLSSFLGVQNNIKYKMQTEEGLGNKNILAQSKICWKRQSKFNFFGKNEQMRSPMRGKLKNQILLQQVSKR